MTIRPETLSDIDAIHALNEAAFPTPAEAELVALLRAQASAFVSLVADDGGKIVGHILFTPVTLSGHPELTMMGLAPMAVLPASQRREIGSALVRAGLDACRYLGVSAVVVLGHPDFYPRFGFVPASRFGISSEYDVPDEVFMAIELKTGALTAKPGTVRYHPAFGSL